MSSRPLFQLDPRLQLCASLVDPGACVADIGTDHAYLPVWLARMGWIKRAYACDLREGPLEQAVRNIEKYRVETMVETRLSDGLDKIQPQEVDTVVIAGMGGEVMVHILEQAPWLKEHKTLILQPMTSVGKLRLWLLRQGYEVSSEKAVRSQGKLYSALKVRYTGNTSSPGDWFPYIGLTGQDQTPEAAAYIRREICRLEKKENGLRLQGSTGEAADLQAVIDQIKRILEQLEKEEAMQ